MSVAHQIATQFTAIDKFTAPIQRMERTVMGFANRVEGSAHKAERAFRRLAPSIGGVGQEIKNLAVAGGIAGLTYLASDSILEYGKNLASFRTIVSDLNDNEFSQYQKEIKLVALETKKSSIDVVQSFEKIAGLNADFAKTSEGLAKVSKAAITLSKASGDELGTSAENLVGIMNQFNKVASQSDQVINVLAAGQAVGASSIIQSAEAYKNFGAVANSANITLEQSQGLIQTLGQKSIFGSEAGTKLRGSVLRLQAANLGYASGQFNINDALDEARKKMNSYSSAVQRDAFLTKTFGAENITAGLILLDNIDTYKNFTKGVTGTSEAYKAAEINSATLGTRIEELKNKFVTLVTTNTEGSIAMKILSSAIGALTSSLDVILLALAVYLTTLLAIKTVMFTMQAVTWAVTAATTIYSVVLGVANAVQGKALMLSRANTVALYAQAAAQWVLNAAQYANPTVWIVAAVIALIAVIALLIIYWEDLVKWFKESDSWLAKIARILVSWVVPAFRLLGKAFGWLLDKGKGLLDGIKPIFIQLSNLVDMFITPLIDGLKLTYSLFENIASLAGQGIDSMDISAKQQLELQPINTRATQEQVRFESQKELAMSGNLNVNVGLEKGLTGNVQDSPNFVSPKVTRTR